MTTKSGPLDTVIRESVDVHEAKYKWGDATPADLLAAGIRFADQDPNAVELQRDEDDNIIELSVWDIIPDHLELRNAMRRLRNRANNVGGKRDKREIIAYATWKHLSADGQFFQTENGTVYYFYDEETTVYRVSGDGNKEVSQEFRALTGEVAGVGTGRDGSAILKHILDRATRAAPERELNKFSAWDDERGELYITDFDDGYYALDGDTIEYRTNGTDVFFAEFRGEPYEYIAPGERSSFPDSVPGELSKWHGQGDLLMRFFGNRVNFDPGAILTPEQQRTQMYIHLHAMAFLDYFVAKPITAFVGEKGSGKTVIQRSIGRFLFGGDWTESMMPTDREDFSAIINNRPLAFVDNFDQAVDWANDILASVATGSSEIRRQLYTTMDAATMNPDCFVAITSRDPPFRRDDVADRTIVFRVTRFEKFLGMNGFLNPVTRHRDSLWSEYLDNLNDIVNGLSNTNIEEMESTHRMSDWAGFSTVAADVLGVGNMDETLEGMQQERALFALEDDTLFRTIRKWLADNGDAVRGVGYTAGDLLDELDEYAERQNIDFTYQRSQTLGKRLHNVSEEMDELFGFEIIEGRTTKYTFKSPDAAEGKQAALGYGDLSADTDGESDDTDDTTDDGPADGSGSDTNTDTEPDGGSEPDESAPMDSQNERIRRIKAFIGEKADSFDAGVPEDVVVTMLSGDVAPEEKIRADIQSLKQKGELYEPEKDDHLQTT
jgi:hypothetical protein